MAPEGDEGCGKGEAKERLGGNIVEKEQKHIFRSQKELWRQSCVKVVCSRGEKTCCTRAHPMPSQSNVERIVCMGEEKKREGKKETRPYTRQH